MDPVASHPDRGAQRTEWALLAAATLAALLLRLIGFGHSGLTADEAVMLWRAQEAGSALMVRGEPVAPLFPLLAWLAKLIAGPSIAATRGVSLLAGVALVPALYLALRPACGRGPASLAAVLAAFSPYAVASSQQALPHALASLLAVWHFGTLLAARSGRPAAWPVAASGLLLLLAHPWGGVVVAGGALLAAAPRPAPGRRLALAYGALAVLWLATAMPAWPAPAPGLPAERQPPLSAEVLITRATVAIQLLESSLARVLAMPFYGYTPIGETMELPGLGAIASGAAVLAVGLGLGLAQPAGAWAAGTLAAHAVLAAALGCLTFPGADVVGLIPRHLVRAEAPLLGLLLATVALAAGRARGLARWAVIALLIAGELFVLARTWLALPLSVSHKICERIVAARPGAVLIQPRSQDLGQGLAPLTAYLHLLGGSEIPIVEVPSFRTVPDGVPPLVGPDSGPGAGGSIPPQSWYAPFRATIGRYRRVALLGEPWQVDMMLKADGNWRVVSRELFFTMAEGSRDLVVLDRP